MQPAERGSRARAAWRTSRDGAMRALLPLLAALSTAAPAAPAAPTTAPRAPRLLVLRAACHAPLPAAFREARLLGYEPARVLYDTHRVCLLSYEGEEVRLKPL